MSKPSLTSLMAGAAFMAASGMASATNSSCGQTTSVGPDRIPGTVIIPCPSQSPSPSPSPVQSTNTNNNTTNASSYSNSATTNTNHNQATVGNVGSQSSSGITTGAIGSTSSATTGPSSASVDGSNNNTTNFRTKAAAASANSSGVFSSGHGCFRAKGGVSFGIQTVAGGVSATFGGGEEYATSTLKTTDANGKEIEVEVNQCAMDQIDQAVIANGGTPYATDGQIAHAAATAAEASPNANRALTRVMDATTGAALVAAFGRQTPAPVVAPTTSFALPPAVVPINSFNNVTVDRVGPTVDKTCPAGTKPVLDSKGIPTGACAPR